MSEILRDFAPYDGPVGEAHALLVACGQRLLHVHGLGHWSPAYPEHLLARDIDQGRVWSLRGVNPPGDSAPAAIVTLSPDAPRYYVDPDWDHALAALYVTRLAVRPGLQGQRLGTRLMRFVEREGVRRGVEALRLDACVAQPGLCAWYSRLGFTRHGSYRSGASDELEFAFMQKPVPRAGLVEPCTH